jgi:hypothetical protein
MSVRSLMVALSILGAGVVSAHAGGNANFALGGRILDEADWEPVDTPPTLGVTVDLALFGWPVNVAFGLHGSSSEDYVVVQPNDRRVEVTGSVADLSVGVVKTWSHDAILHPYLGGGVAAVRAEKEAKVSGERERSEDDISGALYAEGGVYWRMGSMVNLGLHGRAVAGTDLELGDEQFSADHYQVALILGWSWE